MEPVFLYLTLLTVAVLLVARKCRTADLSLGASEDAAHAAVLRKRMQMESTEHPQRRLERRCKTMQSATAKILGIEQSASPCYIVNVSGSGMRIKWNKPVPAVSQIQVCWGDYYFIGSVSNQSSRAGSTTIGLQLDSCNYMKTPWQLPCSQELRQPLTLHLGTRKSRVGTEEPRAINFAS